MPSKRIRTIYRLRSCSKKKTLKANKKSLTLSASFRYVASPHSNVLLFLWSVFILHRGTGPRHNNMYLLSKPTLALAGMLYSKHVNKSLHC